MAFSRRAMFFKWGFTGKTPANKYAFLISQEGYSGGHKEKPASYSRSLYDGSLLIVRGITTPRKFQGIAIGYSSRPGTTANDGTEDISLGSISDLAAAWAATDLQVKSFEDSSYWEAEWVGMWPPILNFDPLQTYASIPIMLESKD